MLTTSIHFLSFPRTLPPPSFVHPVVESFQQVEQQIGTAALQKGLTSDEVLRLLHPHLKGLGFESGKRKNEKIDRPVFYGENGRPSLNYQIDAFHPGWSCGLAVEAGGLMGNAVYRDLVQALIMVQVDHLILAVAHKCNDEEGVSSDYEKTCSIADALYGHTRMKMPYGLTVIGY